MAQSAAKTGRCFSAQYELMRPEYVFTSPPVCVRASLIDYTESADGRFDRVQLK